MVVSFNFFHFVFKLILNDRRLFLFTALEYVFLWEQNFII